MKYEVWMEGYLVTGMEGIPTSPEKLGVIEANSFQEACDMIGKSKKWAHLYDSERRSIWGCRLFQTYEEACELFKDIKPLSKFREELGW